MKTQSFVSSGGLPKNENPKFCSVDFRRTGNQDSIGWTSEGSGGFRFLNNRKNQDSSQVDFRRMKKDDQDS
ncbi:unnamed protein product [Rhizophagus irregularis]|nr:unnamed protein product [Rhizophagus irregularis]